MCECGNTIGSALPQVPAGEVLAILYVDNVGEALGILREVRNEVHNAPLQYRAVLEKTLVSTAGLQKENKFKESTTINVLENVQHVLPCVSRG